MNTVLAGDYLNAKVIANNRSAVIYNGPGKSVQINKDTVAHYEVAGQATKSGFSVGKAALGAAAFGDVGAVAGIGGNKKSIYRLDISFRDGKRSLLEVDGNTYNTIAKTLFGVEDYVPYQPPKPYAPQKKKMGCFPKVFIAVLILLVLVLLFSDPEDLEKPIPQTPVPSPVDLHPEYITNDEYDAIENGMTYEEVVAIIGGEGEVSAESEFMDVVTRMVVWKADPYGANATITFQNGEVVAKAKFDMD